jgi:hypothetical protein
MIPSYPCVKFPPYKIVSISMLKSTAPKQNLKWSFIVLLLIYDRYHAIGLGVASLRDIFFFSSYYITVTA